MKSFGALRIWMPFLGLGAVLALAPQSRAQADVSPDHFDENGVSDAPVKPAVAKAKPAAGSTTQAHNPKTGAHATSQAASNKKPAAAQQPALVAVNDKRKAPAQKPKQ